MNSSGGFLLSVIKNKRVSRWVYNCLPLTSDIYKVYTTLKMISVRTEKYSTIQHNDHRTVTDWTDQKNKLRINNIFHQIVFVSFYS